MLARTSSLIFQGLTPVPVEIEVSTSQGIPKLVMIGLANKVVRESKERVLSCLKSEQIQIKSCRTVINLTPVDVPKRCRHLELGILASLLAVFKLAQFKKDDFFFGSLSLSGEVKSVPKAFALVLKAKELGAKRIFLSADDLSKVKIINRLKLIPIHHFSELLKPKLKTVKTSAAEYGLKPDEYQVSLNDLTGQEQAKRVLEIAAAGGHHLLLTGPPGCGKTLLAQALRSILPPLEYKQVLESCFLRSVAGRQEDNLFSTPVVAAPHHLITPAQLLGGGRYKEPGLVTQAHHGILFLDELNLFNKQALEGLRQPLVDGRIRIESKQGSADYPARFILIAAQNPCPCGYFGTQIKPCTCSPWIRKRYRNRLSGALLDRIDLFLNLKMVEADQLLDAKQKQIDLDEIKNRISSARKLQRQRYCEIRTDFNAGLTGAEIKKYLYLNQSCRQTIDQASKSLKLSNRSLFKVIKVAQTLADLEESRIIKVKHLQEALMYRSRPT